jgi:hypothetical protein
MAADTIILGHKATYAFASLKLREQINLMPQSGERYLALNKLDELDYWAERAASIEHVWGEGVAQ